MSKATQERNPSEKTKRTPKPPMTPDTVNLISLIEFLKLDPETVTPEDLEEALLFRAGFQGERITAEVLENDKAAFLSLKKTLMLGRIMILAGLGRTEPGEDAIAIARKILGKMKPDTNFVSPFGWGGIFLSKRNENESSLSVFEADVIKTISGSFSVFQTSKKKGDSAWKSLTEKPNGYYFIGCCMKCLKVFEKKRGDQEYCSSACKAITTQKRYDQKKKKS